MRKLRAIVLLTAVCLLLQTQIAFAQTAAALVERAETSIEKREFDFALKDLTQPVKLEPKNSESDA